MSVVNILQIGKAKSRKRGTLKIIETMVNDFLLEMCLRTWKLHPLYQGDLQYCVESRGYRKDTHGPGYRVTDVRMIGAPNRGIHNITPEKVKKLLEDLVLGNGPGGSCWPDDLLGEWLDDPDLATSETLEIELYNYASLTTGKQPRLEASAKASGEIDNSWFSIGVPRQEPGPAVPSIGADTLWSHDFPPNSDHLNFDQEMTTLCCQVNPNYLIPDVIAIIIFFFINFDITIGTPFGTILYMHYNPHHEH